MIKHGFTLNGKNDRFYRIYYGLRDRTKSTRDRYKLYHGLGCEWKTFEEFKHDMYESYLDHVAKFGESETSIDRIDNSKGYSKENCRWATHSEQTMNRRVIRNIEVNGKVYNAQTLSEECNIPTDTASWRITSYLKGKITLKGLLSKGKVDQRNYAVIDGYTYYNKDIESITGVNSGNARRRLRMYQQGKITKEQLLSPRRNYPSR